MQICMFMNVIKQMKSKQRFHVVNTVEGILNILLILHIIPTTATPSTFSLLLKFDVNVYLSW